MDKFVEVKKDERGNVAPVFDMGDAGEIMFTTIKPGKIRGNHYHKQKKEQFCIVEGNAKISVRNIKTEEKKSFSVSGDMPQVIEIFPFWTHSIENVGQTEVKFVEYANMPYNAVSPDSFPEAV